jgi:hypothetical protein
VILSAAHQARSQRTAISSAPANHASVNPINSTGAGSRAASRSENAGDITGVATMCRPNVGGPASTGVAKLMKAPAENSSENGTRNFSAATTHNP